MSYYFTFLLRYEGSFLRLPLEIDVGYWMNENLNVLLTCLVIENNYLCQQSLNWFDRNQNGYQCYCSRYHFVSSSFCCYYGRCLFLFRHQNHSLQFLQKMNFNIKPVFLACSITLYKYSQIHYTINDYQFLRLHHNHHLHPTSNARTLLYGILKTWKC